MQIIGRKRRSFEGSTDNAEFLVELQRIIGEYLGVSNKSTPSEALQQLFNQKPYKTNNDGEEDEIPMAQMDYSPVKITPEVKKLYFFEEIRFLLLSVLAKRSTAYRETFLQWHIYAHLISLHFSHGLSLFEKVNEFLNINYKLENDDFYGHARRGNLGELEKLKPELRIPMEELSTALKVRRLSPGANDNEFPAFVRAWQAKHRIDKALFKIVSGSETALSNDLEWLCYCLAYGQPVESKCSVVEIIMGNFIKIEEEGPDWLRLAMMLVYPMKTTLRACERLFESIAHETADRDYQTCLDFLAYSRSCEYYFNILINKINLNALVVESLVGYTAKMHINNIPLVMRYAYILQNEKEYERLSKHLMSYSVCGFEYSREFFIYFIDNFARFEAFMDKKFLVDDRNRFVYFASRVGTCDLEALDFLIGHAYFTWAIEKLVCGILENEAARDITLANCLKIVLGTSELTEGQKESLKKKIFTRLV